MKILIITSIEKGGIGGPSLYADNLPAAFARHNVEVDVLRPGHFVRLVWSVSRCDILYSLSGSPKVNIPVTVCAKIFRKKFCIRPGGDFLWERATERGDTEKTPREYYKSGEYKKRRFSLILFRWTLARADRVIFPTLYLRDLYQEYFFLPEHKCEYVDYPFPYVGGGSKPRDFTRDKQFVFAGRLIKFKNGERLIRAFAQMDNKKGVTLKIIGEGPEKLRLKSLVGELGAEDHIFFADAMNHNAFLSELRDSYCAVVPSIFEPGSFFMLECLKLGIPVIFTKASGLYDAYANKLLFVDPYSVPDIKEKIKWLLDANNYSNYAKRLADINTQRCWDDVAREHKVIFEKL